MTEVEYERVLTFDLSSVHRTLAGPSNPHAHLPTSELAQRGIAVGLEAAREEERARCLTVPSLLPLLQVVPTRPTRAIWSPPD
ncbi:hypothetical protein HSBAA_41860 [Vreelandella sulfidaeris]|uniref:Uncharacterized protein n=1 Tax=Vreelandella sulfidaeris TaxID=115553 RepID=A0A455U9L2_9GAMM|nr:hypothetical protein HSBAA_41860 [Halomonas sulfidaeris]